MEFAELFFHNNSSSWGDWGETWNNGDWIICGGCAWWEHQGWNLLLCGGFDQVQPKLSGWCLREDGSPRPNRSHQPLSMSRGEWSWFMDPLLSDPSSSVNMVGVFLPCSQKFWKFFPLYLGYNSLTIPQKFCKKRFWASWADGDGWGNFFTCSFLPGFCEWWFVATVVCKYFCWDQTSFCSLSISCLVATFARFLCWHKRIPNSGYCLVIFFQVV